jgi:hypothetical protein
MKLWLAVWSVIVLAAGGWILRAYRRRLVRQELARLEAAIKPPRPVYAGLDEGLRRQAERRRDAAEDKRRDAARIASGQSVEDRLRLVRR